MQVEEVLAEFVCRETRGDKNLLTTEDIDRWMALTRLGRDAFLDALAIELARKYEQGRLLFEVCDAIVNDLFGCTHYFETLPEEFAAVYAAFDAGEYYHDNNRLEDPEEAYTRPMIREVLERRATPRTSSSPE
jgi:hypothetical protein